MHIFGKFLCSLINLDMAIKKIRVVAKILMELYIFLFVLGSPLNFDKEKWYYKYIEEFLKNYVLLIFLPQFCDLHLEPCLIDFNYFWKTLHLKSLTGL